MAAPVLVRAYTGAGAPSTRLYRAPRTKVQALPAISSYAFADILKSADCEDFQSAINGIAEICAKSRMSLADEYASHLPPLGEITAASSAAVRPHLNRPGVRRALTSVPEGSSDSSEGSGKSNKRPRIFGPGRQSKTESNVGRRLRIGSMGRTIAIGSTVAATTSDGGNEEFVPHPQASSTGPTQTIRPQLQQRSASEAMTSLRRLLENSDFQAG